MPTLIIALITLVLYAQLLKIDENDTFQKNYCNLKTQNLNLTLNVAEVK